MMDQQSDVIRVLLTHPTALVRRSLQFLLSVDPTVRIVGEASCPTAALGVAKVTQPDVLLFCDQGKQTDLPEQLSTFRDEVPDCRSVLICCRADRSSLMRCLEAGTFSIISQDAEIDDLLRAIHSARNGCLSLSADVAKVLLRHIRTG